MKETTDATLTKSEKNRILGLVREFGPPAEDFRWSEKEQKEQFYESSLTYLVSVLEHRPTGHYCVFGAHCMTTFPGISRKVENSNHENDWGRKESLCGRWLVGLRDE